MAKIKLDVKRGDTVETITTTMFVIAEWERIENRRFSDGRGIGMRDLGCWAHILLKVKGEKLPESYMQWLEENPDMEITDHKDVTDPNPTDAATAGN